MFLKEYGCKSSNKKLNYGGNSKFFNNCQSTTPSGTSTDPATAGTASAHSQPPTTPPHPYPLCPPVLAGLDTNPGKTAQLFSNTHPNIKNAYPGAKEAVQRAIERVMLDEIPTEKGRVRVHPKHGKKEKR